MTAEGFDVQVRKAPASLVKGCCAEVLFHAGISIDHCFLFSATELCYLERNDEKFGRDTGKTSSTIEHLQWTCNTPRLPKR